MELTYIIYLKNITSFAFWLKSSNLFNKSVKELGCNLLLPNKSNSKTNRITFFQDVIRKNWVLKDLWFVSKKQQIILILGTQLSPIRYYPTVLVEVACWGRLC